MYLKGSFVIWVSIFHGRRTSISISFYCIFWLSSNHSRHWTCSIIKLSPPRSRPGPFCPYIEIRPLRWKHCTAGTESELIGSVEDECSITLETYLVHWQLGSNFYSLSDLFCLRPMTGEKSLNWFVKIKVFMTELIWCKFEH